LNTIENVHFANYRKELLTKFKEKYR